MSSSSSSFYLTNKRVNLDFFAENTSSDGGMLLLYKLMRNNKLIKSFSNTINDTRDKRYTDYSIEQMIQTRVLLLAMGYEDANDLSYLGDDPVLQSLIPPGVCSQPTMSRLENSFRMSDMYRLCEWWVNRYVESLPANKEYVIIDVDGTDDPTYGNQQGSLFHGYYWQYMLNELLYIDGETGQVILPVLRPGNVHSNKWNHRFLRIMVQALRGRFPNLQIIIRADAGFSCPDFYELVQEMDLDFCVGVASNERLKKVIEPLYQEIDKEYAQQNKRFKTFMGPFSYQADSWPCPQDVYAKIESTGKGMNVRFFVSNFAEENPSELYKDFYVQRGEASENRIKEIKNMCFSDRLSCHRFSANFFRLMLSCLAYELLRGVREIIKTLNYPVASRWNVHSIRLYLLKVAAQVRVRVKSINFSFSTAFPQQELFLKIMQKC